MPLLKAEVLAGISQAWECSHGADVARGITRLDTNPTEWVMCLCVGRGLRQIFPEFLKVARRRGWPVRIHTENPAMARLLERYGLTLSEFVLRG